MPVEGPCALDMDKYHWNLGEVGQPKELVHQREAGTAGGGEGTRTVPRGANDHADGGEFVFGLHDGKFFWPVSGSILNRRQ